VHLASIADDDELTTAFDEVKAPLTNFADKDISAHLAFDIANRAPDDAALADRLCSEDIVKPGLGEKRRGAKHLHDVHPSPAG
jgi:hypothetical protein